MSQNLPLAEVAAREVRAEMGRQRISGIQLAGLLGVSDMYLSRRLTGQIAFDLAEIERVAIALNVPVAQLLQLAPVASAA